MDRGPEETKLSRPQAARNSVPVELTEIPVLGSGADGCRERVWEELNNRFWREHPIAEFEDLRDEQLAELLQWTQSVHDNLSSELQQLQGELRSEWALKEQLLDQLLEMSIGTSLNS